tara:strand:+ start:73 stop:1410 length:1338 start_codon:yes stop_codon:yes gene_type:complete
MAKYKATNKLSAWQSFYYRMVYRNDGLPATSRAPEIKDFSLAENVLYGRVDTVLNTVYPLESTLKIINNSNNVEQTYRVVDFVADAFNSVQNAMINAKQNGTIPSNDPIFSNFSVKRAYMAPINLYNTYISNLMDDYIQRFLGGLNAQNRKHIIKFNQFVENFILYLSKQTAHTPVTFTSWQRSKTSNIFTSGIAIDIGGLQFGNDRDIERLVFQSPCFPYFLKVCRANGFLVSQLSPTIIVADILSPGLLPYSRKAYVKSTQQVFSKRYKLARDVDYELLQNKLIDGFNLFVATYPFERIVKPVCKNNSSSKFVVRDALDTTVKNNVSISDWLAIYVKIRNLEERNALSPLKMDSLLKQIKTTKYLDNNMSMRYINNIFRNTYKSKYGGTNYYMRRQEEKQKNKGHHQSPEIVSLDAQAEPISPDSLIDNSPTGGSSGGSSGGY